VYTRMHMCCFVCTIITVADVYSWNIPEFKIWHDNSPATRLLDRKKGWIEQGKIGEIMRRGNNGKTKNAKKKRDRTSVKLGH